jgi:4'-phosphopantetheinyl transferase EntD
MTHTRCEDLDLAPLVAALRPFHGLVAARRIRPGDEAAFPDPEGTGIPLDIARRRGSGAARLAARRILSELGSDPAAPLRRLSSGAPGWPEGVIGSLAHDEAYALAAVARRGAILGLGVDVEPAEPLPADLVDFVLTPAERQETARDPVAGRLVFAAKEAVYKAIHPLDGSALEYPDIEIRLAEGAARLRDGRSLTLFTLAGKRLVALALVLSSGT